MYFSLKLIANLRPILKEYYLIPATRLWCFITGLTRKKHLSG